MFKINKVKQYIFSDWRKGIAGLSGINSIGKKKIRMEVVGTTD